MAEFQEVIRQWRRMCADGSKDYCCAHCNMYSSIDESICRGMPDEDETKIIEGFVMAWAAEHPESVYPTWWDWFAAGGLDPDDPIPADTAQKLGIGPITPA